MPQPLPRKHARTHLPGGSDPLEITSTGPDMWPTMYAYPLFSTYNYDGNENFGLPIFDNTSVGGVQRINKQPGQSDAAPWSQAGRLFVAPLRLGPQGSYWAVSVVAELGPNAGRLSVKWATVTEETDGSILDIENETYVAHPSSPEIDLYAAGSTKNGVWTHIGAIRLMGADGDALTSIAYSSPDPVPHADGGAGLWAMTLNVDGKHASSSEYRCAVSEVFVKRIDENGL